MANSYIEVPGTSEKLQTYENTIGGQSVHSEAVTLTDSAGAELKGQKTAAASIPVVLASDQETVISPTPILASDSGTTLAKAVATPGNAIRLYAYSAFADPENTAKVIAGLRWTSGGTDFVTVPLSQYGGVMSHSWKSQGLYVQGGANEDLYINLSAAQAVYWNFDTVEVTP